MKKYIVPQQFLAGYQDELSRLFHRRINLYCYIAILVFSFEVVLGFIFFRRLLSAKDMPGIIGGILFSAVLLVTAPLVKSLRAQKTRAFFFSLLLVLISVLAATAHPDIMVYMGIGLVLLALFPSVLLLPWNWIEAALIGLFAIINFIWVYRLSDTFVNNEIFGINVILLSVAVSICVIIKRSEEILRQKDFIFQNEIEEKNSIMTKELELARKIHKSLIPHSIKDDLADIAVTYKPMFYLGGDYAKFHFLDRNRLIFVLIDVTGHGVSAALLVNRVHTEIEQLIREDLLPGELLKRLEEFINRDFGHMGMLLTAFCGLLDFANNCLVYSNHGHPPQILFQASGKKIVLMKSQTFLMGVGLEVADVCHNEISFEKGDRIILFTDGIIEARNRHDDFFGRKRLESFAKNNISIDPVEFNDKLMKTVKDFQADRQEDDIFLLTIQTKK